MSVCWGVSVLQHATWAQTKHFLIGCCSSAVFIWCTLSLLAVTSEGNIACSYAGAMPLLAAMLETNRPLSKAVYPVLLHLLRETPSKSIRAEAESLFAQLNGARRLSNLLCPYFSPGDSACAKAGM